MNENVAWIGSPEFQMWATFALIGTAIFLFAWGEYSLEIIATGIVTALLLLFYLFPVIGEDGQNKLDAAVLLQGFANPVLFAIMALLIIGQGLFQTGAVERISLYLGALGKMGSQVAFAATFLVAGGISAFLNNTPVVVMFIPIVSAVAAQVGMAHSRVLMPLSFICVLGGMTTLVGSSANLIAATLAEEAGFPKIGFFDFVVPGLLLASLGAVYVIFIMPHFLAHRETMAEALTAESGKQFIAQISLGYGHPWAGEKSTAGLFPALKNMTVRMVQRGEKTFLPPFEDVTLCEGDVVIVAATRKVLASALTDRRSVLTIDTGISRNGEDDLSADDAGAPNEHLSMAETVIAPGSRLIGRSIEQSSLRAETNCIVLGLQRKSRMMRKALGEIRLEAGDVLLIVGTHDAIRSLRSHRDLLLLEWSRADLPVTQRSQSALLIFAITIASAAVGLLPIAIAALLGAMAMIGLGCINVHQAARAIDRKVFLLIGAAFAMAEALQYTGGAHFIASGMVSNLAPFGPAVVVSAFFLLTAILTNFLSNHATAALLAPIAVETAASMGVDPAPFVYALIFALNCCFATPIAYQTNLIVMTPGHYQFSDFVKAGLPLIVLLWLAYSVFAPFYFGL